ncbi:MULTISPECIES: ribosomal-processing cysteine protease Prp [Eubacteriales]|uniref:ribosomal-processing cysteine protease Prp n=1 Tax=Eubacteriales TaxID=186802 RepID=UPI0006822A61|nr:MULTISPECIES: ribosomal-processing cysteine protease Prp [Eubacteriales]
MICAEFLTKPKGDLVGFRISGHSGCGDEGTDIICAAVSSVAYMTANTITEILRVDAEVHAEEGYMLVRVPAELAKDCRTLFAGFKLHMLGLEEQYPENINVSYVEV